MSKDDRIRRPLKCMVFGCKWGFHPKLYQITDSIAVIKFTCERCGNIWEFATMHPSQNAVKKYQDMKENDYDDC